MHSDMIGGNQRNQSKQLFIRWLQASVFMPSLQFSVAPWDFDDETVEISLKFTKLHHDYGDLILERFMLAVSGGDPGSLNNFPMLSCVTFFKIFS